jgi:hypothetical protein
VIKLDDKNVEVITIVNRTPPTSSAQKSTVGNDELFFSYIAGLERLEYLGKSRNIGCN